MQEIWDLRRIAGDVVTAWADACVQKASSGILNLHSRMLPLHPVNRGVVPAAGEASTARCPESMKHFRLPRVECGGGSCR